MLETQAQKTALSKTDKTPRKQNNTHTFFFISKAQYQFESDCEIHRRIQIRKITNVEKFNLSIEEYPFYLLAIVYSWPANLVE